MKVDLPEGKYVVAVSGGVDSVVLLDLLSRSEPPVGTLVVAHFDHGIRIDSADDAGFVRKLAEHYGLRYYMERKELGTNASEALARQERYAFLRRVQAAVGADAIVTAHHEDDVIETMLLNLIRGSKWRGLQSLRSTVAIRRPLLGFSKAEIIQYADANGLSWREDSTNEDLRILRNYLRRTYLPKLSSQERAKLLHIQERTELLVKEIDMIVNAYIQTLPAGVLVRDDFRHFDDTVAYEMLAAWLRHNVPDVEVTHKMLSRLAPMIRTGRNGSYIDIQHRHGLRISRLTARLQRLSEAG